MPSNTPGRRKGSQASQRQKSETREPKPGDNPEAEIRELAMKPKRITTPAAAAAREKEFQRALWPAASAPGNSVHVRLTEISWKTGRPTARLQSRRVQAPQAQNQPAPSCWRKSLADTGPSVRGQGSSRLTNHNSRSSGGTIRGQLIFSAPMVSKVVLK